MTRISVVIVAVVVSLFGAHASAQDRYFSIASAPSGGVYYPLGGGLAALLSEHMDGVSATAEATSGSVENVKLTGSDPTYLGFASADVVLDAARGVGAFDGEPLDLRTLLVMYPNTIQVIVNAASGINAVEDLRGKRVGTGTPGSGFEMFSVRLLEAAGMNAETDVERVKLSTQDTINALRDGKIDAMVFIGGLPAAGLTDLLASRGAQYKFLPIDDHLAIINAEYDDIYSSATIPGGTYPEQTEDVSTIGVWNILVANAALSHDDAKAICEVVFGNLEAFRSVHPVLSKLALQSQRSINSPVPLHTGATACFTAEGLPPE